MKIKTDNYIKKLIISKLFNEQYYHKIKLFKIILDYLIGKDYEDCKTLLNQVLRQDFNVFDIGANMGQYACRLSDFVKSGKIYSFEPYYLNYISLRSMKKILRLKNVVPIHSAISDQKGPLHLMIPIINNNLIIGTQAVLEQFQHPDLENVKYRKETVYSNTIDNFVSENKINHVDFIKIDTEGAEIAVINGGLETIKKDLPILSIEISPSNIELNCLFEIGYEIYRVSNKKLISFNQNSNIKELTGNIIFINKSRRSL